MLKGKSMNEVYSKKKIDIIWNITQICMWDCEVCCVDAVHVKASKNKITVRSEGLNTLEVLPYIRGTEKNYYEQVLDYRKAKGLELTLEQKLKVLENLKGYDPKIDFSGGDPLTIADTLVVMKHASQLFGKHNITMTATGAGLARADVEHIGSLIGELNFTYDSVIDVATGHRPKGYASSNLEKAKKFAQTGVKTRGETPLTKKNIDDATLTRLYLDLHEAEVNTHLIMRLFPSGRGTTIFQDSPTINEYRRAIELLRNLEAKYLYPKVKLQCALKFLEPIKLAKNPCDMVTESFGLMADGTLLASPWAFNSVAKPISEQWVLGNLVNSSMKDILNTQKAQNFINRADENYGHCKIHAYFQGGKQEKAVFEKIESAL